MKLKISESKKGKKTIEEYYDFSLVWTIINWFIYYNLNMIIYSYFLFILLSLKSLDYYNKLWAVSIFFIFAVLWIKQSYGNFYWTYQILLKRKWLSQILGKLHGILLLIWITAVVLSNGKIILIPFKFMAQVMFFIGLILTIYIYFKQNNILKGGKNGH